jgi:UDP-glucose 4-epimerase
MVIPRFVQAAITDHPINIFGDGKQSRVFCHVKDAVNAILLLAVDGKTIGEVFNIGGIGELSILDLAQKIISQTKSKSNIIYTSYDDVFKVGYEDMIRRVPDISKIKNFIKWEPGIGLTKIIDDVIESLS